MLGRRIAVGAALLALGLSYLQCGSEDQAAAPERSPALTLRAADRVIRTPIAFEASAAEIVVFDGATDRAFVINAEDATVDVLRVGSGTTLERIGVIGPLGPHMSLNSVAAHDGVVALAVERVDAAYPSRQLPGQVRFYDAETFQELTAVAVGAQPDMLTFTPDGTRIVVANEGEPSADMAHNPEGSVAIIDVGGGVASVSQSNVRLVTFRDFNLGGPRASEWPREIRPIFPSATRAEDVEPEYVAITPDSSTAYVVLQEHNALAVVDLASAAVTSIRFFGTKDHRRPGQGLDASDRDDGLNIKNWPVLGLYQPDAMVAFSTGGETYLVTANEGDTADYEGFSEETRIAELVLDPTAFPEAAELQRAENLGRLKTTTTLGDTDGDGDVDVLYSCGGRSFSIWHATTGRLVFDSGDDFESRVAAYFPDGFNASNDTNRADERSDDKGPEPEGIAVGAVGGRIYAFIGLERVGGIMVYDVTEPEAATFVTYANNRNFDATEAEMEAGIAGDLGPEGLAFVSREESPSGVPLLLVGNEVTGSVVLYEIAETTPLTQAGAP